MVFVTVDQLRGDAFSRYARHLGDDGFSLLRSRGIHYQNATYAHAITETAPGHATLFTGAAPATHGIVGNGWLGQDGKPLESVDDATVTLLGPDGALPGLGQSPRHLLAPTLGDELARQTGGRARGVAVSAKARGAILPAGTSGRAYWLGGVSFVTSSYYGERMPEYAALHQRAHPLPSYVPARWELAKKEAEYQAPESTVPGGLSEVGFPHALGASSLPIAVQLKHTPFGDLALFDFALAALDGEGLGQDDAPDLLAVSLSSTDYIGHAFGPESRESEDHFIRLGAALGDFIQNVERKVDAGHVLWVLSADHGGLESPEALRARGLDAGRLTEAAVQEAAELAAVKLGVPGAILDVSSPYVTLDRARVERSGKALGAFRAALARELSQQSSVAFVHAVGEPLPEGALGEAIGHALHPARSGDLYVVPKPFYHFVQEEMLYATHGSPWQYDRHVPILIAGPGVPNASITRPVDVRSIAPTVLSLLGYQGPSAASAPVLVEAVREGWSE